MLIILNNIFFLLFLFILLFSMYAQFNVYKVFKKYSKIYNDKKISGIEIVENLKKIYDMEYLNIKKTKGYLTDYYNPIDKSINLSENVQSNCTITSIAIAAHEMGHALQDKQKNFFLMIRNKIFPFVSIFSNMSIPLLFIGVIFELYNLILFGMICYSFIALFQIITFPIEIDASKKALKLLIDNDYLNKKEISCVKDTLNAAALTYFAAMTAVLIQMIRFFLIYLNIKDR